ncbi:MAG: YdeI/OmpD-associated family protein [Bacteroidetes bacterium]|nr:YdeI/OmpD-associated family protein [Bacteroidota bacterium]
MGLASKLRLNPDTPLVLIEAPDDADALFKGFEIKTSLAGKGIRQVIFFAVNKKSLDTFYPKIIARLADDFIFWIAYPKQSSGITSDLTRMTGNARDNIIYSEDYTIVSSAAIDDTWTGMRIKKKDPNAKYKREVPIADRKTEGIDYVKRIVKLPKDAIAAMKPYKGLEDFFNTMSFTHKKEYVEAIVDAKKPETRQRRIEKMIEMVGHLKTAKEIKKKK